MGAGRGPGIGEKPYQPCLMNHIGLFPVVLFCGLLVSCSKSVDMPYALAVEKTGGYLSAKPWSEIFSLKKRVSEDATSWGFYEGPYSKSAMIFPMEVTAVFTPIRGGEATALRVKALKRNFFFNDRRPETAAKWTDAIISFLEANP